MAQTHSLDLEAGSSQYASIADASQTGLDITGDISIEAWVKLESQPGTDDVIRRVGWAITAEPNTILFNPSNDYITHV